MDMVRVTRPADQGKDALVLVAREHVPRRLAAAWQLGELRVDARL